MKLSDLIIEHGPYYAAQLNPITAPTTAELNELREELIALRRKAEAFNRLFAPPTAPDWTPPAPYVFVQWKGTELCGDFHCECGASGHIDDDFAYSVECPACGKIWELPIHLPLIVGRDEPRVLVQRAAEHAEVCGG